MTRDQMVKEFGPVGSSSVSYNGGHSYESVTYEASSGPNIGSRMSIMLVDGVVQNVNY